MAPEWEFSRKLNLWFRNVGIFIQDNFGFRATLPALRREMRAQLDSPDSKPFYAGRDGQLFWGREQTPAQTRWRCCTPARWCAPPTWTASSI